MLIKLQPVERGGKGEKPIISNVLLVYIHSNESVPELQTRILYVNELNS